MPTLEGPTFPVGLAGRFFLPVRIWREGLFFPSGSKAWLGLGGPRKTRLLVQSKMTGFEALSAPPQGRASRARSSWTRSDSVLIGRFVAGGFPSVSVPGCPPGMIWQVALPRWRHRCGGCLGRGIASVLGLGTDHGSESGNHYRPLMFRKVLTPLVLESCILRKDFTRKLLDSGYPRETSSKETHSLYLKRNL